MTDDLKPACSRWCPSIHECAGCRFKGGAYGPADEQPVPKQRRKEAGREQDARHQT